MPDIQFIGLDKRGFDQEKEHVRRRLIGVPYADKLNLVWFESVSEGLVDRKSSPFLRIQGTSANLDGIEADLEKRLAVDYDIEFAHNKRWVSRKQ